MSTWKIAVKMEREKTSRDRERERERIETFWYRLTHVHLEKWPLKRRERELWK